MTAPLDTITHISSTIAASTNTAAMSRRSNSRLPITLNSGHQPPPEISDQKVSGLTGMLQKEWSCLQARMSRHQKAYEAFAAGDLETAMSVLDDSIEWFNPGNSKVSGSAAASRRSAGRGRRDPPRSLAGRGRRRRTESLAVLGPLPTDSRQSRLRQAARCCTRATLHG